MANDEFKAAFIAAIRAGGSERERAFRFFEEKLTDSFKGAEGIQFFTDFIALVKEADPGAVEHARDRFYPLIDEKELQRVIMDGVKKAGPELLAKRQEEVRRKQVIVDFIDGAEKCKDEELPPFIAHFLEGLTPEYRVVLVEFLWRRIIAKY